ncbi:MAG: D-alanyl-D-alanine carboxypeptidase family protein [Solirubrobacteraceae bacterium]
MSRLIRVRIRMRGRGSLLALCAIVALLVAPASGLAVSTPDLQVTAAGLIAESTGQQLYGLNASAELPIASTTKIMTALVTLQHVKRLDTMFTQNDWYAAAADSQIGLVPGERMTERDLLLALMLPSADDAAEDLAYNVGGGSIASFVAMMNADAQALGLSDTHYSTPIGLDTPGNYSSAWDLDKLAAYLLQRSALFRQIVSLPGATLATGPVRYVVNRNDLIGRVPWINGVKTGHTADAGYVLVASGTRDGMTLVGAVLGTSSESQRDQNALALLDYGFAEFHLVKPLQAGQRLAVLAVAGQPYVHASVIAGSGFQRVVKRTDDVRLRLTLPRRLIGPLRRDAVVGEATVLIDGSPAAQVPIVLARALPAAPSASLVAGISARTLVLLLLIVTFVALVLAAVRLQLRLRTTARDRLEAR